MVEGVEARVGEAEEAVAVAEVQPSDRHSRVKDEILAFHRVRALRHGHTRSNQQSGSIWPSEESCPL